MYPSLSDFHAHFYDGFYLLERTPISSQCLRLVTAFTVGLYHRNAKICWADIGYGNELAIFALFHLDFGYLPFKKH